MNIWKLLKWAPLVAVCIAVKNVEALDIPQYEIEYQGKIYSNERRASLSGVNQQAYLSLITELGSTVASGDRAQAVQTINSKMNFSDSESSTFLDLAIQS
ncbi:MAG: hypothetical protein VB957_18660 [Pseudomonadales bacterium]